jgi:Concanavalin A-like lectin/glucanases superfamily
VIYTPPPDVEAPVVAITAPTSTPVFETSIGTLTLGGTATDNVGVVSVSWTNSAGGSGDAVGTQSWSVAGIVLQEGSNLITVTAEDEAGNGGVATLDVTYTPPDPSGLVAAYNFDEGAGPTLTDYSTSANDGTLDGATWTTSGKYGGALSFDGTNDRVIVGASSSLDLVRGMTLEAWIQPTVGQRGWRTIIHREQSSYYLHASMGSALLQPVGGGHFSKAISTVVRSPTSLPVGAWSHLAVTYDGAELRLYINGALVASTPETGDISQTTEPLSIGGNGPYGEYFEGLIDEVRIYNRALGPSEIQADMATPVSP